MPEHPTQNGIRSRIVNHRATSYVLLPILAWWITLVMIVVMALVLGFAAQGELLLETARSVLPIFAILSIGPGLVLGLLLAYIGEGVNHAG